MHLVSSSGTRGFHVGTKADVQEAHLSKKPWWKHASYLILKENPCFDKHYEPPIQESISI